MGIWLNGLSLQVISWNTVIGPRVSQSEYLSRVLLTNLRGQGGGKGISPL